MQLYFRVLILSVILLCISSCTKKSFCDDYTDSQLSPKVLGHAGMGWRGVHPMDSKRSVKKSLEIADGVEFDIQLSKDGVFFLFHDQDLKGSTNCTGKINSRSSSYLKECRFSRFELHDKLATLEEVIQENKELIEEKIVVLDLTHIKIDNDQYWITIDSLSSKLCNVISNSEMIDNFYLDSRDQNLLKTIRNKNPNIKLFWELSNADSINSDFMDTTHINGVISRYDILNDKLVIEVRAKQLKIIVWGCNNKKDNDNALKLEPDIIITDYIRSLIKETDCK